MIFVLVIRVLIVNSVVDNNRSSRLGRATTRARAVARPASCDYRGALLGDEIAWPRVVVLSARGRCRWDISVPVWRGVMATNMDVQILVVGVVTHGVKVKSSFKSLMRGILADIQGLTSRENVVE